jgi:predicted RNase H-like nuclease (RuvC/YqgF family)
MAANQYDYEDEYEDQDNGPADLRKALKKAQKEREALEAELNQIRKDLKVSHRQRSIGVKRCTFKTSEVNS